MIRIDLVSGQTLVDKEKKFILTRDENITAGDVQKIFGQRGNLQIRLPNKVPLNRINGVVRGNTLEITMENGVAFLRQCQNR